MGRGRKRRFQPKITEAYALITYPQQLRYTPPEVLADIHDAAFKFGVEDFFEGLRYLDIPFPVPFRVIVSTAQTNPAMVIFKNDGTEETETLVVPFAADEEKNLVWDVHLQPRDVVSGLRFLDKKMARRGYINPKNGERLFVANDFLPALFKVEETFTERGQQVYTPDTPKEIEHARQQFDYPEAVAVWKDENDDIVFCRKSDLDFLNRRREVALWILQQRGLQLTDVGQMSEKELNRLNKEIDEEMARCGF